MQSLAKVSCASSFPPERWFQNPPRFKAGICCSCRPGVFSIPSECWNTIQQLNRNPKTIKHLFGGRLLSDWHSPASINTIAVEWFLSFVYACVCMRCLCGFLFLQAVRFCMCKYAEEHFYCNIWMHPYSLFVEVFLLTWTHVFECQLEIWLFHALEVALQKANEDVDCEPGLRYVFTR